MFAFNYSDDLLTADHAALADDLIDPELGDVVMVPVEPVSADPQGLGCGVQALDAVGNTN